MKHYLYILITIAFATIVAAIGCMDMPRVQNSSFAKETIFSEDKVPEHEENQLHGYGDEQKVMTPFRGDYFSSHRSQTARQLSRRNHSIKTSNSTAIIEGKTFDCHIVCAYILNKGLLPLASKNSGVLLLRLRKLLI